MATKISNCGHDENGRYHGGRAGDQGGEYTVRSWYSRPWQCILRYPEKAIAEDIALIARYAAENDMIGYDQYERQTYFTQLTRASWDPRRINVSCETDCSASTAAAVIAVGYRKGIPALQRINPNLTTWLIRNAFVAAGFQCLTDKKYLNSSDFLLPGDILLNDGAHVAINLTAGVASDPADQKKQEATAAIKPPAYKIGNVYTLQVDLNVRTGPTTTYRKKNRNELSADGQKHSNADGSLKKGTRVSCLDICPGTDIWIRTPSGWLAAYFKGKTYIK